VAVRFSDMDIGMKQKVDEQLSAFLDDELPPDELQFFLRRLEKAEDARNTLSRYALIGAIMRDEFVGIEKNALREGIDEQVTEVGAHKRRHTDSANISNSIKAYKGLGIAAALALIAFLSVNYQSGPEIPPQVSQAMTEPTYQAVDGGSVVGGDEPAMPQTTIPPVRLTTYMVSHGEYARTFPWTVMDSRAMVQQASFEE
ncbi:MAG: sigma-E factor negative regulatory protein, partial [Gammaproteobacteria bacterium]